MEREKLIAAARLLKENCKAGCRAFNGYKCPFSNDDWDEDINPQDACMLYYYPHDWDLSEVQDKEAVQDMMAFKERYKDDKRRNTEKA